MPEARPNRLGKATERYPITGRIRRELEQVRYERLLNGLAWTRTSVDE